MRRSRLWLRWSARDLRSRWVLVLTIALVIAIGTGIYTGLGSMENWRVASNDASFASLDAHDLEISLTEGTFAKEGELDRLAGSIRDTDQIAAAEERLVVPTQIAVKRPGDTALLVSGEVIASRLGPHGPPIDGVAAEGGRGLRASDSGQRVAVLDASFAEYHDLPQTGSLRLAGGAPLEYVGLGRSPEYFLVTRPGGGEFGGAEASFAAVFTSLRTAQDAIARPSAVNDIVLRLDSGADGTAIKQQLDAALEGSGFAGSVTSQADETAHRILYKDAEGDQKLFNIFAVLILAGAALATFNLASRIVESQRREIGVGMALGVTPAELAIRPVLLGIAIALAGVVCGTALGLLAGDVFRGVLEDLLPLPETRTPFEPAVFARGAIIGLVLPIIATVSPVWRGVRLQPIDAIRVGFRSARSSGLAALGTRMRLPGPSIVQLPLRNVLRAPRRGLMTALGIAAVVTVVVAFLGFVDSFRATVDTSEAEVAQGSPDRINVAFDRFESSDSKAVHAVEGASGVERVDRWLAVPASLGSEADSFDASITLLDFRGQVWTPTISNGSAPATGQPGIVLAQEAARDLSLEIGDRVTVTAPVRKPNGSFREMTAAVEVTGFHPNPFRIYAYMDESQAAAVGLGGLTNLIALEPAAGTSEEQIARELFGRPGIASAERATATSDLVRDRLDDFVGVLRLTVVFALALALLIAFNSTSISADERARENATMLAFGIPVRSALGVAVGESLITGIIGTLLGIGGGLAVIGWVVAQTLPRTLPDLGLVVSIGATSILVAALVGVIAVALAPLLTARRLRRMDVPSTLRVVE